MGDDAKVMIAFLATVCILILAGVLAYWISAAYGLAV